MHCKHCGKEIEEVNSQHQPQKMTPLWFKTLIGCFTIIIAIILCYVFFKEDPIDTVENQLKVLRKGNLSEAYYDFTSKKFRKATSLQAFNEFIGHYPAFSQNKSIRFKEREVNADIGMLECVLTAQDNKKMIVAYQLVKESDQWKISKIRLEDDGKISTTQNDNRQKPAALKFNEFILGNTVSSKGLIERPKTVFKSDAGDIYLNVYLSDASAGTPIKVILEHLDSESSLNPVTTQIPNDGKTMVSFVFSPPPSNWPTGKYRIIASSPSNEAKNSIEFLIK